MNVNISLVNVLAYAFAYLEYFTDMYRIRLEHGYKKNDVYRVGLYEDLDNMIRYTDKAEAELRAICDVTGLNFWALFDIAKYTRRICGRVPNTFDPWSPSENEIERLYHLYDDEVRTGIYQNEFFDRAITRLQNKEYEQKKQAYLDAEYEKWIDESERELSFPDPNERSQDDEWDYYWSSRGVQTVF